MWLHIIRERCVHTLHVHEYCFYRAHGLLPRFMWINGNAARRWYIARSPIKMFDRWVLLLASQINYAAVIDNFGRIVSRRKVAFLNLANQLMIMQLRPGSAYCLETSEVKVRKWVLRHYFMTSFIHFMNYRIHSFYELSRRMNDSFFHCFSSVLL